MEVSGKTSPIYYKKRNFLGKGFRGESGHCSKEVTDIPVVKFGR